MSFENATPRPWKKNRYGQLEGSNGQRVHVYDLGVAMAMNSPDQEERDNAELIITAVNAHEALLKALNAARRDLVIVAENGGSERDPVLRTIKKIDKALKLARAET